MERVENIARILHINETYDRDDHGGPDWGRVLRLYSDWDRFVEVHGNPTAAAVIRFYVIDKDNPTSISSTIFQARHNARSVRHLISTEMWTQLNIFSSEVRAIKSRELTTANLSTIASSIINGCQNFEGIAEGTFMHNESWCFYQIGKYIERADQTTRILDMGYDRLHLNKGDAVGMVQWNLLLRSVSAYHAYRSRYPGALQPTEMASFLLYDEEFPRAVKHCVDRITARLHDIEKRHKEQRDPQLEKKRRSLEFTLETGPGNKLTPVRLHNFLDGLQKSLGEMSNSIEQVYFN